VNVHVLAETLDLGESGASLERLGGAPVVRVMQKPLSQGQMILKEIEDRVLGALILALLLPLFAVIAAAIKLDSPGPVFFRQLRFGYGNRLIEVMKFRTMREEMTDPNAERLTSRDDPRVTKLGRFLRRTSLDELPQFINVVRGEMSIVGPRPHARSAKAGGILYPHAVEAYAARHKVKPGITGLAQINGWRGETRTVEQIRQRVAHDMAYIRNWSLLLDLKIIVITAFTGFSGRDAY
jgi:exopolysaccharide biosynthesis polyprenyl glycosylphosphotransferase